MMRILHAHSTFSLGGKEARAVRLMNALGDAARHTIISAMPDALDARDAIAPGVSYQIGQGAPSLTGRPSVRRYREIAEYLTRFDLVLTYNWGAMDVVMARRIHPRACQRLVHHEDGFNADESVRLKTERTWFRRVALPAADALAVPSTTLERVALDIWKQPRDRVHRINNGIDVAAYANKPDARALPGFRRRAGEVVVGTVAGLRAVKNLPRLVRATLAIPNTRLVIVGEGPERSAIVAAAQAMGVADRLSLPGFVRDPARYLGLFDIFALSSDSEQFPIALVEGMAAGLPVAATDVGDVRIMLSEDNRRFATERADLALGAALRQLVADPALRRRLGDANRRQARERFDETIMIDAYRRLYHCD